MTRKKRYTISEAANYLKVTPEAILKAIRTGRLKARLKKIRVPRQIWFIAAESVETYEVSTSHQVRGLKNP